jgi:hypothetical protein
MEGIFQWRAKAWNEHRMQGVGIENDFQASSHRGEDN